MPSATPRRQSSHRRRRSTNTPQTTHQPRPPRAQAQRRGNVGYPQRPGTNGASKTKVPTSASGTDARSVAGRAQPQATPRGTPKTTAPLPPLELERTTGAPAAPPPPPTPTDASRATPPLPAHPRAHRPAATRTSPPPTSSQPVGARIPPLPRATHPPSKTPPKTPPTPTQPQQPRATHAPKQQPQPHAQQRHRRAPNVRAALAYAIPIVPALWLLVRERRPRFIRLHAAQSLVFFSLLALAQVALYVALVILGQTITDPTATLALGILFLLLFGALGIGGFILWLLLLTDALSGRLRPYPGLSRLATVIESGGRFRSRAPHEE